MDASAHATENKTILLFWKSSQVNQLDVAIVMLWGSSQRGKYNKLLWPSDTPWSSNKRRKINHEDGCSRNNTQTYVRVCVYLYVYGNNINNTISYPGSETEQDCGNSTPTSSWKP